MKKMLAVSLFILALSGCGSDTDKVKNGILEFNKTITVGQALDNWKSCENRSWEEFSADNGTKIVQFTCQHTVSEYMNKAKTYVPEEVKNGALYLDVASNLQTFQFTINKDDTFQIHNVSIEMVWADGEKSESQQAPMEQLEMAYANKINFDPKEINEATAGQLAFYMKLGKPGEKYKKIAVVEQKIVNSPPAEVVQITPPESNQAINEEPPKTWLPSFNCNKAATFVETSICSESILGSLDGALSENYKYMLASDIGEGAVEDLKSTQKKWMAERNKCTTIQCIEGFYRTRIDEVCEYPVISGVHPVCTMSVEIK
jgi:hypothetical protein